MELRSGRSRSRTPFLTPTLDEAEIQSTRITRSSTYKYESYSKEDSSQGNKKLRTRNASSKHTSDYSSGDDGEYTVSSSIAENLRNHSRENEDDHRSGRLSALKVYRDAKEYWKDRVELSPGVVNMPNMSRRPIHESTPISMDYTNKETNTSPSLQRHNHQQHQDVLNRRAPRMNLFNNNNGGQYSQQRYERKSSSSSSHHLVRRTNIFVRIVTTILSYSYSLLRQPVEKSHWMVLGLARQWHRVTSKMMCLDAWLLRSNKKQSNKSTVAFWLCLIPLLFLGGWFLIPAVNHGNATTIQTPPVVLVRPDARRQDVAAAGAAAVVAEKKKREEEVVVVASAETATVGSGIVVGELRLAQLEDGLREELRAESGKARADAKTAEAELRREIVALAERSVSGKDVDAMMEGLSRRIADLQGEIGKLNLDLVRFREETEVRTVQLAGECCKERFAGLDGYVKGLLRQLLQDGDGDVFATFKAIFVAKDDLEGRFRSINDSLLHVVEDNSKRIMADVAGRLAVNADGGGGGVGEDYVKRLVKQVMDIYDADKTGLVDFALESAGGQIVSIRCTDQYTSGMAVYSIFGIPIWKQVQSPRVVITPGVHPGNCWCFQNFPGFLVIKLWANVTVDAFSYEHASRRTIGESKLTSAPKGFSVFGLRDETDPEPVALGDFAYDKNGEPLQYFHAEKTETVFSAVELRINSNHGNPSYTCLYRFRVHGQVQQPT
ncbi:PREDICTED: SUN domain-containing protein 2-like isoform X2 [Nicrophorus vespilloides]|uniref:SUN domain-containing protein 2-like isoform X2 n=1 Tax=Nicrophorus vespilloides TaxID=110193 RepID=A0ABM1M7D8_NICVS|nr:PREDICTED: SUN domain-containing protein 2-like isoform X2 [Nicrophorus vespilloides]